MFFTSVLGYVLGISLVLAALSPVILADVLADSFTVDFDKQFYVLGDSLTVSGEIIDFGMPIIAVSIYDPDGKILSANNLEVTLGKTFAKTIQLDSSLYEKTGEYLVKLEYGQISKNHYFVVKGDSFEPEVLTEKPEIVLLYTEKNQYTDEDTVKITGLVSAKDSLTVLIGIYDPFGVPAGFYFSSIDSDLKFTTSFLVKDGVNFRSDGTYSVKARYAETEATSFFDYYKEVPKTTVKDSLDDDDNKTDESALDDNKTDEPLPEDKKTSQTITTSENDPDAENTDTPSESQTTDDYSDNPNTTTAVSTTIETPQKTQLSDDSMPKTTEELLSNKKTNNLDSKVTNTVKEQQTPSQNKTKKENNLTVEDVELGKVLNQIKLKCDSSTYTDTISYYDGMGPALYRLCEFDDSLNFFNESLISNPDDVEVLVNKGSTLGKLGYLSEAIAYYDHAITIDPNFLPAKNNKANALANLGHFNDAVFLYGEILEQNPNYLTARKNLETALSSNFDLPDIPSEPLAENTSHQKPSLPEKTILVNPEKQKPSNFFDEVGIAFSALGSLFDFLR